MPQRQAANEADLVIMFGTDHQGSNGTVTLTRQSYATPWGVLPTDQALVDKLAEALGQETAFAEELHHAHEHSIELAAVWLHFTRGGRPVALLPILCGSFGGFVAGERDPATYEPFDAVLRVLRAIDCMSAGAGGSRGRPGARRPGVRRPVRFGFRRPGAAAQRR